jgi:hypothetical protein
MSRKQQRALGAVIAVAAGAATWLVGGLAHASKPFPQTIEDRWNVDQLPVGGQGCLLCHTSEVGGSQNMTQRFGLTVKSLGVGKANVPALERALDTIKSRGIDSDSDRATDYEEVAERGTNPNVQNPPPPPDPTGDGGAGGADAAAGGEAPLEPLPPLPPLPELPPTLEHGCSLTAAGAGVADAGAPVSLVLAMLSLLGCKRHRSSRQR